MRGERVTTAGATAARRVTYQLETLWDYDYVPTHDELATLYETAKKNQWNGSAAIDWNRPVGTEGPVLNAQMAFMGTDFFPKLSDEERKEVEIRVSAWRLSQFLHGEQGVPGRVRAARELDSRARREALRLDPGRRRRTARRGLRALRQEAPQDLPGRPAAQGTAGRDPGHQPLGAEAPGDADDRRGPRHRRLQRHAQADGRPDARAAARLRPAGRRAPRELRLLRAAALDPEHGSRPSASTSRTSPSRPAT